ncbi:hypothetical protein PVAND_000871 [Polypedilum vanderplanki]|uniref:Uncharacterized protein n=1 Tax=Polypedilum vanderplanki TaxID=319348 RepID=A0A9J6BLV0_POLVA|nr:hypothetical protein PVAND_000871 [Polypedilum vanderplanki]
MQKIDDFIISMKKFNTKSKFLMIDMRFFEFFVTHNQNHVHLSAHLYYSENNCGNFTVQILNTFDLKLQNWKQKLVNFEHFDNFHSCILPFYIGVNHLFYPDNYRVCSSCPELLTILDKIERNEYPNLKFHGLTSELLEMIAIRNNLTIHYTVMEKRYPKVLWYPSKNFEADLKKSTVLITQDLQLYNTVQHWSKPFDTMDFYFLVTQNEFYTNYEKLLFPFDTTTWILLLFTFGLTFGIIFGLKITPKWIRILFMGRGIRMPGYNALGIFFGISQLKLPKEIFSRLILLLFIWFCLIIRTCWQSMMFEFMTSDMRKPLPESVEDLVEHDYTVILMFLDNKLYNYFNKLTNGRPSPNKKLLMENEFFGLYKQALNEEVNMKLAFVVDTWIHSQLNATLKNSLPIMKNERGVTYSAFTMFKNHMLLEHLNYFLNQLIPSGIPKFLSDYNIWYLYRPYDQEIKDSRKILSLYDLEFGYVLWLFACFVSFVAFLCELCVFYGSKLIIIIVGIFEFLKLLKMRLVNYNDRWT